MTSKIQNDHHPMSAPHRPFSAPEMLAKKFDAPERDLWQKPEQIMDTLQLAPDAIVAELGSGTGYFAVRLARRLEKGKLICLDSEPKMLEYLRARCAALDLSNVDVRPAVHQSTINLAEKIDLLFSVDTYHHLREPGAFFASALPFLKADGQLVVIDRKIEPGQRRVAPEAVIQAMQEAGFALVNRFDFLAKQYFLVFAPDGKRPSPVRKSTTK